MAANANDDGDSIYAACECELTERASCCARYMLQTPEPLTDRPDSRIGVGAAPLNVHQKMSSAQQSLAATLSLAAGVVASISAASVVELAVAFVVHELSRRFLHGVEMNGLSFAGCVAALVHLEAVVLGTSKHIVIDEQHVAMLDGRKAWPADVREARPHQSWRLGKRGL